MPGSISVGGSDSNLNVQLSDALDSFNAAAFPGPEAEELTVSCRDEHGTVIAGISGWTWRDAASVKLAWVRDSERGAGLGGQLLRRFEAAAQERGAKRISVSSFTFQAPAFYVRHGYREIFRVEGVPVDGQAKIHLHKDL